MWLKRDRAEENVVPSNSPKEAAVARPPGQALADSFELSHLFSEWLVASERYVETECELEGSARRGRAVAARGRLPLFRLKSIPLVQGRLLEVKRFRERGPRNTGQFRKSVDFLKKCAGELPTILASDQDPTRILHSRRLRSVDFVSIEVNTGMVHEAGSRLKIEASRDRARVLCEKLGSGPSRR